LRRAGGLVRYVLNGHRPRVSRRATRRARRRARRARNRAEHYLSELPADVRKHPAQVKRHEGLPDHLPSAKFSVPWRGPLALFVLGLVLVLTLATLAGQRERRAKREQALEAELQEIVAEEEARETSPSPRD
jgi:hypothetical protein